MGGWTKGTGISQGGGDKGGWGCDKGWPGRDKGWGGLVGGSECSWRCDVDEVERQPFLPRLGVDETHS